MKTLASLRSYFLKFLESGAYCTPPGRAACALASALTLAEFERAQAAGLVRLRTEDDPENYFDVYGKPEAYTNGNGRRVSAKQAYTELCALLDRTGNVRVIAEYFDGYCWQHVDSIGQCAGYNNPLSPFENCYVVDLMRSALDLGAAVRADMELEQAVSAGFEPCPVI